MAAATTQRPQDRAEQINADVAQRARAIVGQHGDSLGLTEYEQKLDRERAVAVTEASLLRGHVHKLCREVAELQKHMLGDSTHSLTVMSYGRPVLLGYRVDEDGVSLERVNGLDAAIDAGVLDQGQIAQWQAACERDYRAECEQAKADAAIDAHLSRLAA